MSGFAHHRVTGGLLALASVAGVLAGPAVATASAGRSSSDSTATAVTPVRGIPFGGSTSSGDPIMATLSRDGALLTRLSLQFRATCTSGERFFLVLGPQPRTPGLTISSRGRFGAKFAATADQGGGRTSRATATVTGTVKGLKLFGSARQHVDLVDAAGTVTGTCDGTATFKAVASPSKVYAGVTTQSHPIVIELAARAKSVHHFHFGWRASCTPAGGRFSGVTLTDLPITKGRFGGDETQTFSDPEGLKTVVFSLRGRIVGLKATGTFRLKTTTTDTTGATTTCDTGSVSFRTSSG